MIERHGGAMLAERVGVGKTYTALAPPSDWARRASSSRPPASLRGCGPRRARVRARGRFSDTRSAEPERRAGVEPDLVIVDESHRVRNPATRRYAAVAALCGRSRVLLVTATPVQNARADLRRSSRCSWAGRRGPHRHGDRRPRRARCSGDAPERARSMPAALGPHGIVDHGRRLHRRVARPAVADSGER